MNEIDVRDSIDGDAVDVEAREEAAIVGKLETEEPLSSGEIVSPDALERAIAEFREEFGPTDARLSFAVGEDGGLPLLALRPFDGDGDEAIVLATKVEA